MIGLQESFFSGEKFTDIGQKNPLGGRKTLIGEIGRAHV